MVCVNNAFDVLILSEEGNPAGLSSCSGGLRPLVELCVEHAGLCGRCTGVSVPLGALAALRPGSGSPALQEQGRAAPVSEAADGARNTHDCLQNRKEEEMKEQIAP